MSYNSCGTREKPKKADFTYKGICYWINSYDSVELWDDEYYCLTSFSVKEYNTDKEIAEDNPLWDDNEFHFSKVRKIGFKVFSGAGSSEMFSERYYG